MNRIGCGIFSLLRFSYLLQLIKSLEKASGKEQIHFYLFQDGGRNLSSGKLRATRLQIKASVSIFEDSELPNKEVVAREHNVGIPVNMFDGIDYVFERHPIGVFLENDIVVSSGYFELMLEMLEKYGGMVKAGDSPNVGEGIKQRKRVGGSNWAIEKENWKKVRPFLKPFITEMRKKDYAEAKPKDLRERFGCPTQDCIRSIAAEKAGVKIWETAQPKVRFIGLKGSHGHSEQVLGVTQKAIEVKIEV